MALYHRWTGGCRGSYLLDEKEGTNPIGHPADGLDKTMKQKNCTGVLVGCEHRFTRLEVMLSGIILGVGALIYKVFGLQLF